MGGSDVALHDTDIPSSSARFNAGTQFVRRRQLTLRAKVAILLAASLVLLLVLLFFPLRQIFLTSFSDLERQNMQADLIRAINAIDNDQDLQKKMIVEYGAWDDTYAFVEQPDAAYIDNNYTEESFINRRSNFVLLIGLNSQLVFGRNVDLSSAKQIPLPAGIERLYAPGSSLINFSPPYEVRTSVVQLPSQIVVVSAYPILTSQFEGPSHGTVIFGRTLDAAAMNYFGQVTQLPIQIYRPDDPQIVAELGPQPTARLLGEESYIYPLSDTTIVGYLPLHAADGSLAAVLRIARPRDIYQREQNGLISIGLAIGFGGLCFAIVLVFLLDRVILARLAALNTNLAQIGGSGDLAGRVAVRGSDELAELATTINATLAALEQSQIDQQRAKDVAAELNQRFIATVSHELRTPLTPIHGYLDLLLIGAVGEVSHEQIEILQMIKRSVDRMSALVEDTLMVSSLNMQGITLHIAATDLRSVLDEAIAIFQVTSAKKQIELSVEIDDQLPPVAADKRRLYQIIWNLLSNALKYTPDGGRVIIRTCVRPGSVEVQIVDTGVGLTPEQQAQLFTPFYRAENVLSAAAGGTGLGLTIVDALVKLHGGTIWVTSAPNAGSTFAFSLPLATQNVAAPPPPNS